MGAEVNRGLASCCLGNDRMEIGSQEEKIGSNQQLEQASRNNVVDFDFLFEFSPERRAESDPHFIQDQAQQGGVGEAERGASRRAEVRPYPNPGSRLQRFMKQINQNHTVNFPRNQSKYRSTLRDEKHQQAGEIPPERSGVPSPQEAQIPVLGRHDP